MASNTFVIKSKGGVIMRVPKLDHFENKSKIQYVNYDKPVPISRYPVVTNERQREKLVKTIETYIRSSLEYKDFIKYLKEYINMNYCSFFHNVDAKKKKGVLEIHHEPFDLFAITEIVMMKQETEMGYIDELLVAEEVMQLHYMGLVGLIPLSITCHQLVHDGKLAVPLNCVYGRFVEFTRRYYDYIIQANPNYIVMLNEKIDLTKKLSRADLSILDVRYVYTITDGFNLPEIIKEA